MTSPFETQADDAPANPLALLADAFDPFDVIGMLLAQLDELEQLTPAVALGRTQVVRARALGRLYMRAVRIAHNAPEPTLEQAQAEAREQGQPPEAAAASLAVMQRLLAPLTFEERTALGDLLDQLGAMGIEVRDL